MDPTYNVNEIKSNPVWHVAWVLSEIRNDSAPIGWGSYIATAECLLDAFDIKPKEQKPSTKGRGSEPSDSKSHRIRR